MIAPSIKPGTREHRQALDSFRLAPDLFRNIAERIYGGYSQATPNDEASAAGTYAYFAAVRGLRDILCPLGWHAHRDQNLEMIFAPDGAFAIIPSSGDKNTGIEGTPDPKTKNPKGSQTDKKVLQNQNQGWLFPDIELSPLVYAPSNTPTWFLLYHIDTSRDETRMELSLPINIHIYNLRVDRWKQRIILPAVMVDSIPIHTRGHEEAYSDYTVEIKRKTNE